MKVKSLMDGKTRKIDSFPKALDVLDDIGCSNNLAYLVNTTSGMPFSLLVYNAFIYGDPNLERFIVTPKTERGIQSFLYKIFEPYIYLEDPTLISRIDVEKLSDVQLKKLRLDRSLNGRDLFALSMGLYLKREHTREARKNLEGYADSSRLVKGVEFILD